MQFLLIMVSFVLFQRIAELVLAKRNAAVIRKLGGYEVGRSHYKYIVLLHSLFLPSLVYEVSSAGAVVMPDWWAVPFALFVAAQLLRYWCIYSLGYRWNTRIFALPDSAPLKSGPYRFVRHPNYLVVVVELLALPLIFNAVLTALLFSLANGWLLLRVRIPLEEQAVYRQGRES